MFIRAWRGAKPQIIAVSSGPKGLAELGFGSRSLKAYVHGTRCPGKATRSTTQCVPTDCHPTQSAQLHNFHLFNLYTIKSACDNVIRTNRPPRGAHLSNLARKTRSSCPQAVLGSWPSLEICHSQRTGTWPKVGQVWADIDRIRGDIGHPIGERLAAHDARPPPPPPCHGPAGASSRSGSTTPPASSRRGPGSPSPAASTSEGTPEGPPCARARKTRRSRHTRGAAASAQRQELGPRQRLAPPFRRCVEDE